MSIEMKGLNELTASFAADNLKVAAGARDAVRLAAVGTERDSKIFAPVDTGALRNSISTTITGNAFYSRAEVGPTVNYGAFLEEGTARMAPHAFMGPAFDRNAPAFVKACSEVIMKAL